MAELAGRVITAALVVIAGPGGTVTFVRQERGPYAGWWLLPGGKVEFGEPVPAAARREAAEESGCDPGELILTGAYEIIGRGHHLPHEIRLQAAEDRQRRARDANRRAVILHSIGDKQTAVPSLVIECAVGAIAAALAVYRLSPPPRPAAGDLLPAAWPRRCRVPP